MAVVLKDRVRGWTNAVGEDAFNISADAAGYQAFSVIGDGNQTYYTCFDPNTGAWEVGIGTYTAATNSLSRDTILSSSNSNAKVLFLPNQKELFVGYPAEKAVATDLPATLTSKTIQSSTLDSSPVGSVTPSTGAFTTLTATAASVTSANMAVALVTTGTVTNFTATSASIASANIGTAVITNFVIEGISVNSANFNYAKITDLVATGASIASANATNLQVTGASIASANLGVALITTGTVTNLTATGASVASANVGVALVTTGTVTNLTATGASIASANLGNAVITSMTITGASVASVNAGVAVVTDLRVVGASITSANVGNLQVTGASVASANFGNVVTTTERVTNFSATSASIASANAAVALITTGTVTSLTATGASVASANVGTAVITGLTVTNASVASLNAGTATITTGNLTFSSTAQRITGDFSNATVANRLLFQTSTTNGGTGLGAIPNGTGTTASFGAFNTSDPANTSLINLIATSTEVGLRNAIIGTGSYLPMTFYTGGSERVRIDTSGNVGIGMTPSTDTLLEVYGSAAATCYKNTNTGTGLSDGFYVGCGKSSSTDAYVYNRESAPIIFGTANTERMRIDSSGRLGLGGTPSTEVNLQIKGNAITPSTNCYVVANNVTIPSGVTGIATMFMSDPSTAAASFTCDSVHHFRAYNVTKGAGSTITNNIGFFAGADLITGTNNFGFYSAIASAANRWNFYAAGTAQNYFAGDTGIGAAATTGARLYVSQSANNTETARFFSAGSGDVGQAALLISKYDNNSTTTQTFIRFAINNNGTTSGQINANGANTVAFGTWSDARLKENIVDLPPQLKNICALRPVEFDYKAGGHQIGFIAQEMQEVYSDVVGESTDGMLTVTGWSKTEARLVKAIQELAARVAELEAK